MTDKLPPFHADHEAAALGCVLDTDNPTELFEQLSLEFFYDERHRAIYSAMQEVSRDCEINLVSLSEFLMRTRQVERCGGLPYISTLPDRKQSNAHFPTFLDSLQDHAARRAAIRDSQALALIASDSTKPWREVQLASESIALTYAEKNGHSEHALSIRTPNELINMVFDETDCLLGDRLLARGQPMTILAQGGTGKSRLVTQLLACIVTGREFIGLPTNGLGMRWLVIQTENTNRRLQTDLHRIKAWLGSDWSTFDKSVLFHTLEHELDGMVYLSDPANVSQITNLIADHKANGVVFDPLGDFSIGDPNKDQDMRDTCRCISQMCKKGDPNRACIVVHHAGTGKVGIERATGYDRSSFGRNSKVLHSWTRGQMNIAAGKPDSNETLVIACGKCSNGKEFQPFAIKLNPDTMIYELDPDFDLEAWQSQTNGIKTSQQISPETVRELCPVGGASKPELSKILTNELGLSRATSYRWIERCVKTKHINRSKFNDNFFRG